MAAATATSSPDSIQLASTSGQHSLGFPIRTLLFVAFGLAAMAAVFWTRTRRRHWRVARGALLFCLLGNLSCQPLGLRSGDHAITAWAIAETVFFHQGVAAGPVLMTATGGSVFEERRYEAYGVSIDARRGNATPGEVDFVREPQNVLNKQTDPRTGWSYHGSRWMAPQGARWMSPDPAVKMPGAMSASALNPYQYGHQNPSLFWDPDGAVALEYQSGTFYAERGDTIARVAAQTGFKVSDIQKANPKLAGMKTIDGGTVLNIPPNERIRLLVTAAKSLGSTSWSVDANLPPYAAGTNKCSAWLCDQLTSAKLVAPVRLGQHSGRETAANASMWASRGPLNGTRLIDLTQAKPGDVFAWKHDYSDATGHVVVFTGTLSIYKPDGTCVSCDAKVPNNRSRLEAMGFISPGEDQVNYRSGTTMTESDYNPWVATVRRVDSSEKDWVGSPAPQR